MNRDLKVLFTSAGRRVELISFFKSKGFIIFVADSDPTVPSLYIVKKVFIVPRVVDEPDEYINALLNICKEEHINILVSLIDPELPILAREKERFSEIGTVVLLSSYSSVRTAAVKYATYKFYKEAGLSTPETLLLKDRKLMENQIPSNIFPAILKPRFGSAGRGIIKCLDLDWLEFLYSKWDLTDNYAEVCSWGRD